MLVRSSRTTLAVSTVTRSRWLQRTLATVPAASTAITAREMKAVFMRRNLSCTFSTFSLWKHPPPVSSEFGPFCLLTAVQIPCIMQVLLNRNIVAPLRARSSLDQQSSRLLGYFDTLFRRLMLNSAGGEEESVPEMSREDWRTLILLDASGRVTMT